MVKPRLFIGSSAESRDVAFAMQETLERDAEVTVWTQGVFDPTRYTLESLTELVGSVDFGVFVFAPDDVTELRGERLSTVRDNVIFELGLFIGGLGRDRTFLLVPRGVDLHLPSDLLGLTPVTYAPDREDGNLVAAIGPAANQVRRKMDDVGALARSPVPQAEQQSDQQDIDVDLSADFYTPKADWDRLRYEQAFFVATMAKRPAEANAIDAAFRGSSLARPDESLAAWDARRELVLIRAGIGGALDRIRSLSAEHPSSARILATLGAALNRYGDYSGAAQAYRSAAAAAENPYELWRAVTEALAAERQVDRVGDLSPLDTALREMAARDGRDASLIAAMRDIAQTRDLAEIALSLGENGIDAAPDDAALRFDLGFKYGDVGRPRQALLHYSSIPANDRNGAVWNNLGVAFGALDMPGEAVASFIRASDLGETIADANLSDKLRTAGFFDQAKVRAEQGMRRERYHSNLPVALDALSKAEDGERGATEEALKRARVEHAFRSLVGAAALANALPSIEGTWQIPSCIVQLREGEEGRLTGHGTFERPASGNALTQALLPFGAPTSPKKVTVSIELSRMGNAIEGTMKETVEGEVLSFLGAALSERHVLGCIGDSGLTMQIWDIGGDLPPTVWTKLPSDQKKQIPPPSRAIG